MGLLQDLEKLKKDLEGITAAEINAKVADCGQESRSWRNRHIVAPIIEATFEDGLKNTP